MSPAITHPVDEVVIPERAYDLFRRTVDAVTHEVGPHVKAAMLARYLGQTTQREAQRLATRPAWLRTVLREGGDALVLRLLRDNWDHTGSSAYVNENFGLPVSSLHREREAGNVIAFRPSMKTGDYVFPLEQFKEPKARGVASWAGEVVKAVGNGGPALHFLYARRSKLQGQSLAEQLRELDDPEGPKAMALIHQVLQSLNAA